MSSFAGVMSHVPVIGAFFSLFVKSPIDKIKDVIGDVTKHNKGDLDGISPEQGLAKISEICGDDKDLAPVAEAARAAMPGNINPFDSGPEQKAPEPAAALSQIAQMVGMSPEESAM